MQRGAVNCNNYKKDDLSLPLYAFFGCTPVAIVVPYELNELYIRGTIREL